MPEWAYWTGMIAVWVIVALSVWVVWLYSERVTPETYEECADKGRSVVVYEETWRTLDGEEQSASLTWECK